MHTTDTCHKTNFDHTHETINQLYTTTNFHAMLHTGIHTNIMRCTPNKRNQNIRDKLQVQLVYRDKRRCCIIMPFKLLPKAVTNSTKHYQMLFQVMCMYCTCVSQSWSSSLSSSAKDWLLARFSSFV